MTDMAREAGTGRPAGELSGRVAVVTGGAAGIGQAVVAELVAQGCLVAAVDLTSEGVPAGATTLIADVRDQASLNDVLGRFGTAHGRIDFLVNNAGVSFVGTVEDGSDDDWHRIYDINVVGYMRSTRAALPFLRKSDAGSIVNMSSCTASNGIQQRALYSATKGAVQSMTMAMAADLVTEGIRVNCVSPGTVDTPFMSKLAAASPDPRAKRAGFEARQPTGSMVAPAEIAAAVVFLLRPSARSSVGTCISVDGGMAALRMWQR